ncbi:MAG TPA: glycine zipper family protein [Povalibacter sp.]|nr:glycine zipper family protein [Povalibacter sp.]
MNPLTRSIALLSGLTLSTALLAADPIYYPAKNQSADQQAKDKGECGTWATQTTGIDPVAVAQTPVTVAGTPPPQTGPQGERIRGAARGAAAGAIVGEIGNNDADEGARYGAAAGAIAGGRQQRQKKAAAQQQAQVQQQQAAQDAEAVKQEKIATYNRAVAACMEGRGYSVK